MNSQRQQEGEGVVGQHHEVHAGEEGREERQHAVRRRFVAAIAEAIEACRRAAEIDDDEEERGQRIEAEMRAEPGQSERQGQVGGIGGRRRAASATRRSMRSRKRPASRRR